MDFSCSSCGNVDENIKNFRSVNFKFGRNFRTDCIINHGRFIIADNTYKQNYLTSNRTYIRFNHSCYSCELKN